MYQRQHEPVETIHLYVIPEKEYIEYTKPINIPRIINSIVSCLFMVFLLAIPASVDVAPRTILVPVQFLPIQTFTTTVSIQPTGQQTIPAIPARGFITVYNGSILVEQIPKGFIVTAQDGTEVITDQAATIPASNPPSFGIARVSAHAALPGVAGNIPVLSVNTNYGGSLYLKNLIAFSGGNDSYTVPVATDTDTLVALTTARSTLTGKQKAYPAILDQPCGETSTQDNLLLTVSWHCQFVTYQVPKGVRVISVQRKGNSMLLEITFNR